MLFFPQNEQRYGHACGVVNNVLYAVGGDYSTILASVEKLPLDAPDQWTAGPPLPHSVAYPLIAGYNGDLWILGGLSGTNYIEIDTILTLKAARPVQWELRGEKLQFKRNMAISWLVSIDEVDCK